VSGSVLFEGRELVTLPEPQMRDLRGNRLAMIFQEPMTSLNPSFTVGDQIAEALMRHRGLSAKAARADTVKMLERVRIPSSQERIDEYPHKLSGGMRQRVMIAMALACAPVLLIAVLDFWWPRPDSNRHSGFPEAARGPRASVLTPFAHVCRAKAPAF
jgi:ABC-type microcin C transport system duplicated ATPase subunit YejF